MTSPRATLGAVVIGVRKCGTTSLMELLTQHPGTITHYRGQWSDFLGEDDAVEDPLSRVLSEEFPPHSVGAVAIARDTALSHDMQRLGRLQNLAPGLTYIAMIRDPVRRAVSSFGHYQLRGIDAGTSWSDVVRAARSGDGADPSHPTWEHLGAGLYGQMIRTIETVVDPGALYVTTTDALRTGPQVVADQIWERVQLSSVEVQPVHANSAVTMRSIGLMRFLRSDGAAKRFARRVFPSGLRRSLALRAVELNRAQSASFDPPPEDIEELKAFFAADVRALREDCGIDFLKSGVDDHPG